MLQPYGPSQHGAYGALSARYGPTGLHFSARSG